MLHLVYRYTTLENAKPRPSFYSKTTCLETLLEALRFAPGSVLTVLSDGPIDLEANQLLAGAAAVQELPSVGLESSFLLALQFAISLPPDEWVYLVEDDYLHRPDSLRKLMDAAAAGIGDYLTLYDDPLRYVRSPDVPPDLPLPESSLHVTSLHHWYRIESTTFTFAARAQTIREDFDIFQENVRRHVLSPTHIMDRESWRQLQGLGPHKAYGKRRRLFGAIPALATHLEATSLAPVVDWSREAQNADRRIQEKRFTVKVPRPPMPGALAIGEEEERAVIQVIRSQCLGRFGGPRDVPSRVEEFERQFAAHIGACNALAVSSGTAALHVALAGLEIGPGDEVIVPAYTWVSTATAVCAVGAVPIIADIDSSLTLDPTSVEACVSPHTRAIIVVHMRGAPAQMDEISRIAVRHGLVIIEDVAQAMGASYRGKRLGTIGNVGCFSLQTYKILTTGEGGIVTTSDAAALGRMRAFHGNPSGAGSILSLNYKMNELAGAVGCVQLDRLESMLNQMRDSKQAICRVLQDIAKTRPISLRKEVDSAGDASVSATFFAETPERAESIQAALVAEGIGSFRYYRPGEVDLHVYPHWEAIMRQLPLSSHGGPWRFAKRAISYSPEMCPTALDLLARGLEITIVPQLTVKDLEQTSTGLRRVLAQYA